MESIFNGKITIIKTVKDENNLPKTVLQFNGEVGIKEEPMFLKR